MTPQRKYQLANRAKGLCERCSRKRVTARHCETHRLYYNALRLARYWRIKLASGGGSHG